MLAWKFLITAAWKGDAVEMKHVLVEDVSWAEFALALVILQSTLFFLNLFMPGRDVFLMFFLLKKFVRCAGQKHSAKK